MYLRKFLLHGFKSFPHKTTLNFTPGITVIVGPNGCGKSNICDALKWVLGEQRVKSLRGDKMEDVIFNGARGQDPSNFSEVELIFDNSDSFFPFSHSEVSVMRRLYRSGDSSYRLNKKNCRLKDIQSLLWGTGLGKNAYSVIEQGQIEQIINAPVFEKRIWIEEAAGITRYRWRKNEALSQLEKVEQDLLRLGDILSEVKDTLHHLKIQANKARRYQKISEELKNLELTSYSQQYTKMTGKIEELEHNMDQFRQEIQQIENKIEEMTAQNETDRGKAVTFQKKYEELRENRINLQNEIKHTGTLIKNNEKQIRETQEEEQHIAQEKEQSQELMKQLKNELRKKDQYEDYIVKQIRQTEQEISEYRLRVKEMEGQNKSYLEGLKKFEEEGIRLGELRTEAEKKIAVLETNEQNFQSHENTLRQQDNRFQERLKTLEREEFSLQDRLQEIEGSLKSTETELKQLEEKHKTLEKNIEEFQKEHMNCHMQLNTLTSRKQVLEKSIAHYDGFFEGVRALLHEKEKNPEKWAAMKAVVADLITVPADYQVAIEAVLGNALQFIVVEKADFCNICLSHIKKNQLGRVTFIPLDIVSVPPVKKEISRLKKIKGIIGHAMDLISYDQSASPAIQFLLNNTIITDTLDTAITLKKQGFPFRFVSLDGEILNTTGLIVGGSHKSLGILERKNSLRRLKKQTANLEKTLQKWEKQCNEAKEKRETVKHALNKQAAAVNELRESLRDMQREMQACQQEKTELKEKLEKNRKELAGLLIQKGQRSEEKMHITKNLQDVQSQLRDIQISKAQFEEDYHGQGEEHKKLMQQLSHKEVTMNSLEARKNQFFRECEYKQQELDRLEQSLEKMGLRHDKLQEKIQTSHVEMKQLKENEKEKNEQLFAVQKDLADVEKEKAALHSILEQLTQDINRLRRDENQWNNALSEEKVKMAQWTTRREDLLLKVQDEYNVQLDVWEVPESPQALSLTALNKKINTLKEELEELGEVNHRAINEYEKASSRYEFILEQEEDLLKSKQLLLKTIKDIDEICAKLFIECYEKVRMYFREIFRKLFKGGRADLYLLDEKDILGSGLDILASPPGKKLRAISLLSGGEKALTAIAFMFALFSFRPSPFCVLDEIDAPLDEYNVSLLSGLIQEFAHDTQFFIITHNKRTIENADTIYGVTMQTPGVSSIVSLDMNQAKERLTAS